ncbi:YolD-like family protein [Paenibacillus sp. LMG 31460]|uniref:YolD-like family protein n=1 Tax=Paenibacillus germinis TaxID=2654979 RepID=A0ABX1Z393_9BACL|nr:YolD-like family protein [Paenibacillus germinis]NOU86476.1 YolD-like family protein [Paenibacillus germinis]
MSKKLERNGLWESSRMMLPQHKESAIRNQKEMQRIQRLVLDEQEVQFISATLSQSQMYKKTVELTLYGVYQPRTITGIVTRSKHGEFRVDTVDPSSGVEDWSWISYKDVLKVELSREFT